MTAQQIGGLVSLVFMLAALASLVYNLTRKPLDQEEARQ